jgi:hypothetical protein
LGPIFVVRLLLVVRVGLEGRWLVIGELRVVTVVGRIVVVVITRRLSSPEWLWRCLR